MAYPVEGKGHGGNRLMCSPRGDSLSPSLSLCLSLFAQSQMESHRHPHLPTAALGGPPGFRSHVQMK